MVIKYYRCRMSLVLINTCALVFGFANPCYASHGFLGGRQRIDIKVIDQPLSEVFADIGSVEGLRVVGGRNFSRLVKGTEYQGSLPQVMDSLSQNYGFIWYRDRNTVFIDRTNHLSTIAIKNAAATPQYVEQQIASLGFDPQRWPLHALPNGGVVVSGPRHYIDMVRSIVKVMTVRSAAPISGPLVVHGPPAPLVQ